MLIRFSVKNFLSFKSETSLSMECEPITEHEDTHIFEAESYRLLKSAVIYGANASGKSNLLKAIAVMKDLVLNSSKESNSTEKIDVEPFRLNTLTEKQPTLFEIEFIQKNDKFRYGFSVDSEMVHEEWLYRNGKENNKIELELFSRKEEKIVISESEFLLEGKDLEEKTRQNALFLSVVANFNGVICQSIQKWFEGLDFISGTENNSLKNTFKMLESQEYKKKIIKLLRAADFGIEDLIVQEIEFEKVDDDILVKTFSKNFLKKIDRLKSSQLFSSRVKYDENEKQIGFEVFKVNESESEGTKKFLALVGPLIQKLDTGGVLLIDELEAKMHPHMTKEIVKLFNSYDINQNNAQLIYATHDTTNLSNKFFRRDQVWFVEKESRGSSELFSLADFRDDDDKRIRKDATYAKHYMLGKFGGIPNFGSWRNAIGGKDE